MARGVYTGIDVEWMVDEFIVPQFYANESKTLTFFMFCLIFLFLEKLYMPTLVVSCS